MLWKDRAGGGARVRRRQQNFDKVGCTVVDEGPVYRKAQGGRGAAGEGREG